MLDCRSEGFARTAYFFPGARRRGGPSPGISVLFFFAALSPGHWGRLEDMLGGIVEVLRDHFGTISGRFGGHVLDNLGILWGSVGDRLRISWG